MVENHLIYIYIGKYLSRGLKLSCCKCCFFAKIKNVAYNHLGLFLDGLLTPFGGHIHDDNHGYGYAKTYP